MVVMWRRPTPTVLIWVKGLMRVSSRSCTDVPERLERFIARTGIRFFFFWHSYLLSTYIELGCYICCCKVLFVSYRSNRIRLDRWWSTERSPRGGTAWDSRPQFHHIHETPSSAIRNLLPTRSPPHALSPSIRPEFVRFCSPDQGSYVNHFTRERRTYPHLFDLNRLISPQRHQLTKLQIRTIWK